VKAYDHMLSHLSKRSAQQYYRDSMLHLEIGVNFNKLLMPMLAKLPRKCAKDCSACLALCDRMSCLRFV
jgi:hypothetical protein